MEADSRMAGRKGARRLQGTQRHLVAGLHQAPQVVRASETLWMRC